MSIDLVETKSPKARAFAVLNRTEYPLMYFREEKGYYEAQYEVIQSHLSEWFYNQYHKPGDPNYDFEWTALRFALPGIIIMAISAPLLYFGASYAPWVLLLGTLGIIAGISTLILKHLLVYVIPYRSYTESELSEAEMLQYTNPPPDIIQLIQKLKAEVPEATLVYRAKHFAITRFGKMPARFDDGATGVAAEICLLDNGHKTVLQVGSWHTVH